MFNFGILLPDMQSILTAVPGTLMMAVTIFVFSTLIGGLFAFIEHKRVPVLREFVVAYKVFFKGVPMVIAIFLAYFGLPHAVGVLISMFGGDPMAFTIPNWLILIIALVGCLAAFQAEVIRGALHSFDKGQSDAALSLGYEDTQMFRRIMLPQIAVAAIPDLANSCMVIMKALSLGFAITVVDIFAQAQLTAALNYYFLEAFLCAVVVYMVISYTVTRLADLLERKLRVW